MTMKRILIVALAFLALAAVPVSAQTYLSTTTLSQAVTSTSQRQFTLASGSGIVANVQLFVDHELVGVASCANTACTIVNVTRNQKPALHASGATVIIAPLAAVPTAFVPNGGQPKAGACNPASYPFLPIVNTDTGDVYLCWGQGSSGFNAARLWHVTNVLSLNGVPSLMVNLQ